MAVTINGDGTISGIGVGGLPDGVVDSGTLATGIDATKLADGTITNSELQYINSLSSNAQTQISGVGGGASLTTGTEASPTSGTTVDFTSLPSGIARFSVLFDGLSLTGDDHLLIQLGDAGGFETTGYVSGTATSGTAITSSTTGFLFRAASTGSGGFGLYEFALCNATNFDWVGGSMGARLLGSDAGVVGGGAKSLSGELTQIRVTLTAGAFDSGSVNIQYWT